MIAKLFEVFGVIFDKIPFLNKIKGGRFILGCVGLAVVGGLQAYGVGDPEIMGKVMIGLLAFCGLALNAKGRSE